MDTDALHSALLSMTLVAEKLRDARANLSYLADVPANLAGILSEAEDDLRVAKATLAGELGFNMCPHCWPPELLIADRDGQTRCPACGPIPYDRAA